MNQRKPEQISVPTFKVDVADPLAAFRINALLVFGLSARKLEDALATYALEWMGILQHEALHRSPPKDLAALGQRLGVCLDELSRVPGAAKFYGDLLSEPIGWYRSFETRMYQPAGGHLTAVRAPGTEQLLVEYRQVAAGGGLFPKVQLLLLATLTRHHPEIPASLNRVNSVLQGWADQGEMQVPTERTLLKLWKEWRPLAPVWAGLHCAYHDYEMAGVSGTGCLLNVLHSPDRLERVVGYAKWFRRFATTFVPEHASSPLIPPEVAVWIESPIPEAEPGLLQLSPTDLELARRYRAPTRKYDP